ncbi:MAG: hypothetical protein ACRDJX_06830 [Solirubrobacteraceae bacterium]
MTRTHLGVSVLASAALLLAACGGGSSASGGVAQLGAKTGSSTAAGSGAASPGASSPEAAALAFAKCMRANGLPNFPDPSGGGFRFKRGAGVDPASPAFHAARAKCKKFMPDIGGPGSGPPPAAKTLAHFLAVAQCMRRHGVTEFPDPKTSAPANPQAALGSGAGVISDIEGVILVFPGSINMQSPTFTRAAAACAFPLHNH